MYVLRFIKNKIRHFNEKNWEKKVRRRLKNRNFSIICSNCIGGIIYHRLGLRFLSPTINLWMYQYDFLKFASNIKEYLSHDLEFINTKYEFPVAKLNDITIHFNHYKTKDEAKSCWEKRKERINYDNLFLIMYDKDGLTKEDIRKVGMIKCKGKIIISNNLYPEFNYVIRIPADMDDINTRYRFDINTWTGKRRFEESFDYVNWLNNGN